MLEVVEEEARVRGDLFVGGCDEVELRTCLLSWIFLKDSARKGVGEAGEGEERGGE